MLALARRPRAKLVLGLGVALLAELGGVVTGLLSAIVRGLDFLFSGFAAHPVRALHGLAGLKVLVNLEEVLDFEAMEFGDILDLCTPGGALIGGGHAEHLIVAALFVAHTEHPEGAATNDAPGEGRFFKQNQSVQRIAVLAERVVDESIIIGIASRSEEHPVQADAPVLVVHLVLITVSSRNLDGHIKFHHAGMPPWFACACALSPIIALFGFVTPLWPFACRFSSVRAQRFLSAPAQPLCSPARPCENDRVRGKRFIALAAVFTLAGGYAVADAADVLPGPLDFAPAVYPAPYPVPSAIAPAHSPLPARPAAPLPSAAEVSELARALAEDPRTGGEVSVLVRDVETKQVLASIAPDQPRVPASNQKLLTAVSALHVLGGDRRFPTTAQLSGNTLYLVGGGDNLLAPDAGDPHSALGHAGLGDLADQVAASLRERGIVGVDLRADATLFSGLAYEPSMNEAKRHYIMEMAPLGVLASRDTDKGGYHPDPAGYAAEVFAQRLRERGIEVASVAPGALGGAESAEVGRVESGTVRQLLEYMLTVSDNTTAQTLGHLLALESGEQANFEGAAKATRKALEELGYPLQGVNLVDNSGLSDDNKVTAALQIAIVHDVATLANPDYGAIGAGLPVSGLNGTLDKRLGGDTAGKIRGKTGTLANTVSLSGVLTTHSGRVLEFCVLINGLEDGSAFEARAAEDEFLSQLVAAN